MISIKFAFTLLSTTTLLHPWLATLPLVHPLSAESPSTRNRSPVSMLVTMLGPPPIWPSLILQPTWCNLGHGVVVDTSDSNCFRSPNVVGMGLSFLGRRTMILSNIFNVGRMIISLNATGMIVFGRICVVPLKSFGWNGETP